MRANIKRVRAISPTTNAIEFELRNGNLLFKPGQYIFVDGKPFSISSAPKERFLEITARMSKNEGDDVEISEPQGNFFFDSENTKKNIMLIGAGTGVAPLLSILRYIKRRALDLKTYFILSSKTEKEILWRKEIESLSDCRFTLTKEKWQGRMGRISPDMIIESGLSPEETDFYLCGSPEFVENIKNMLIDLKIKKENIKHG